MYCIKYWNVNDAGLVEAITPLHLTQLRNILNTSAMDIMYYTSPIFCAEIQRGLVTEINRLYSMFIERNPSQDVKVSIIGHSLGCVIVYDIITGWLPMVCDFYMWCMLSILVGLWTLTLSTCVGQFNCHWHLFIRIKNQLKLFKMTKSWIPLIFIC